MGVTFTKDQQRVIDTRNRNILVSAAAGSGKTAVLVERIIQKICDTEHPVDIDRLLIVTFTSAAAAQMRERISDAIMKRLEAEPEKEHLQKQAALIHNAQITTIDSFCLFIIRNNFHVIGLDPGFRVADEAEITLTKKDVLDKLLEDEFAQKQDAFLNFVECYATGAGEQKIEDAIMKLYHFSMSYPFPEDWLLARKQDYAINDFKELIQKEWYQQFIAYYQTIVKEIQAHMNYAKTLAEQAGGPNQYLENLEDDLSILEKLTQTSDYRKLYQVFSSIQFSALSRKKGTDVDPECKELVKSIRDEMKATIGEIKKKFFLISPEDTLQDMKSCQSVVSELVRLSLAFKERLDAAKREKNIIDFSDMEHFALQILLKKDAQGQLIESETAQELQDYFEEIMIDEYQDSNDVQELLLKSISGESKGKYNRFMVGDVKQSIYKFRLARPEIFMEKYHAYEANEAAGKDMRIDLSMNFRSRQEVTDATNFICGQIMRKEVGNVEYDEKAVLNVGATYYPQHENAHAFQTEILIAEHLPQQEEEETADANLTSKELEAHMVAQKIKELVDRFEVTDTKTGGFRKARFRDIVILFRATTGWDEDFRKILASYNIPVHITSKTGYFQTMEIQGMVNLLKVLDNPLQDIPFFGVLKFPYFQITETEIAEITAFYKTEQSAKQEEQGQSLWLPSLYEQLLFYEKEMTDKSEKEPPVLLHKVQKLIAWLKRYRTKVAYTPIKELIQEILQDTGYAAYVGAMPGGQQRQANIELLLEKAGDFEKTSFYGLFHFVRYLETIQEQDVDFGEVNILDENADVVRIMTIHKSKGLEFPICFVCGLSKQFNQMDMRQSIIMDAEVGIGVDYIDPVLRIKRKNMRKNIVAQRMKEDTRGEDLRVFYVAMTRAKEKLIMTGYQKDFMKYLKEHTQIMMLKEQKLSYSNLMEASSYFDLLMSACMRHGAMKQWLEEAGVETNFTYQLPYQKIPMQISVWNYQEDLGQEIVEEGKKAMLEDALLYTEKFRDPVLAETLQERLLCVYPHKDLEGLTVKTTVSELKKAAYEEELEPAQELFPTAKERYVPTFMREREEVKGTQYGTAVHKVMELFSFDASYLPLLEEENWHVVKDNIQQEIKLWIASQIVEEEMIASVSSERIVHFLHTDLAKRMIAAKQRNQLFREQPFVIGLPANRLQKDYPETETILIQGVIDVFFYEGDELVLMDYKTDRVSEPEELIRRYQAQLAYYEQALTQITGKKVKERMIYSFALGMEISV